MGGTGRLPRKLVYGSDYPYRFADKYGPTCGDEVDFASSYARGGLSNVWGAAVLPYTQEDIEDWPVSVKELAPHYQAVLQFMPLAAQDDDLSANFPLYSDRCQKHRHSSQARRLLSAMRQHKRALAKGGITFGSSRLAVNARPESGQGCVYCGMCLYGCPYRIIYSSSETLNALLTDARFRYEGGVVVEKLEERGERVTIHARRTTDDHQVSFEAERVFLACGAIPTSKILMETLRIDEVSIADSQYFMLPLLLFGSSRVRAEELHTLAQVFIEINDPQISRRTAHLQVYTYNDLYEKEFRSRFGPLSPVFSGLFIDRLVAIQGLLHSDDSRRVKMRRGPVITLEAEDNPRPRRVINHIVRKLARNSLGLRAIPLAPLLIVEPPGRSSHFGGTFPMRASPTRGETDTLGRPHGLNRVHAVDASVLPSIAATTITLTVMANAHRIGSDYDKR